MAGRFGDFASVSGDVTYRASNSRVRIGTFKSSA